MKESKNTFLTIIFLTFIFIFSIALINVKADSGWDSSYDGGSWDSGSDWDSGWDSDSSWDSSYDRDRSSHYSTSNSHHSSNLTPEQKRITFIIGLLFSGTLFLVVFIYIYKMLHSSKKNNKQIEFFNDINVDEKVVPFEGFNKEEFLKNSYDTYLKVQNAWMEFNYDELRKLLSDELFNTYKAQLKVLDAKKQKNVMHDFELINQKIVAYDESDSYYSIDTLLTVKFYDYVIDQNSKKVLRGSDKRRIVMFYRLTFIKSKATDNNKCLNCGASLENVNSSVCPYCNSTIIGPTHDYVLSKKAAIKQRME